MLLASIDIETTGLDPSIDQVLEVGVVLWETTDFATRVEDLPTFHRYVDNGRVYGNAYALSMNSAILGKIAAGGVGVIRPEEVGPALASWLKEVAPGSTKLWPTGKNVGSFDLQFLKRL